MLPSVFFAAFALAGSAFAAPAADHNSTFVPCGVTISHDEFLAAESYFQEHKVAADPKASAQTVGVYFHIISQDSMLSFLYGLSDLAFILTHRYHHRRYCQRWSDTGRHNSAASLRAESVLFGYWTLMANCWCGTIGSAGLVQYSSWHVSYLGLLRGRMTL